MELLILGAFRYLGRGLTFDNIEESTAISEEVHQTFLHQFIKIRSTVFYEPFVQQPRTEAELIDHMTEFNLAGFPGAFGSTNATCIVHNNYFWRHRRSHIGFETKLEKKGWVPTFL